MKRFLRSTLKTSTIAFCAIALTAGTFIFSGGAPDGRSGAPVDGGATCASSGCHTTASGSGSVAISAATQYTPGVGVPITVTLTEPAESTGGFEAVVVDATTGLTHVSTLSLGANTEFASGNTNYVTQSNGDFQSWTFTWTPGASEFRDVTVYVAASARKNDATYTATHSIVSALPVELSSFQARVRDQSAILSWHTESESGNVGFDVQQATDGNQFEKVGFVAGSVDSPEQQDYEFRVDNLVPGKHRFRLRQLDVDGTSTLSPITEVSIDVPGAFFLTESYPNPFRQTTQFEFAVKTDQSVRVAVYNELGQQVATLYDGSMRAHEANQLRFNGEGLPAGTYYINVAAEKFSETRTVVLLK